MPFTETTKITLEAAKAVELSKGVVLPPGSYPGIKAQAREDVLDSGITWTESNSPQNSLPVWVQPYSAIRIRKKST